MNIFERRVEDLSCSGGGLVIVHKPEWYMTGGGRALEQASICTYGLRLNHLSPYEARSLGQALLDAADAAETENRKNEAKRESRNQS